MVKNQLHGLLLSLGIETRRGRLRSARERRRAKCELVAHNITGATVDPLFETIDRLTEQVKQIEAALERLTAGDGTVCVVRTVPGAGLITAVTIRALTDDIARFATPGKYASFARLLRWMAQSNETVRYGRITKRGLSELRTGLVHVLLGMMRLHRYTAGYRIMQRYEAIKRRKGAERSIIAGAGNLAEIV